MHETLGFIDGQPLPSIKSGEILRRTPNFQVVTDYKPGHEGQKRGESFFIEPLTEKGSEMLFQAALAHNVFNFNVRPHPYNPPGHEYAIPCLRADYTSDNVPILFHGDVQVPQPGLYTIPSPDRMEESISQTTEYGLASYSFEDGIKPIIPNPQTRHLRLMQATHLDDMPERVLHSADENSYYKVRKGWWLVVIGRLQLGIESGEISNPQLLETIAPYLAKWKAEGFMRAKNLTTSEDIKEINNAINLIWQYHGNI